MSIADLAAKADLAKAALSAAEAALVAARATFALRQREMSAAVDALCDAMGVARGGNRSPRRQRDGRMPSRRFAANIETVLALFETGTQTRLDLQELGMSKSGASYMLARLRDQGKIENVPNEFGLYRLVERKSGREDEGAGPENRSATSTVGSNPTSSAKEMTAGTPVSVSPGVPNGHDEGRFTPPRPEPRNAAPARKEPANVPAVKLNLAAELKANTLLSQVLRLIANKPHKFNELLIALKCPQPKLYAEIDRARQAGAKITVNPAGYYVLTSRIEGLEAADVR